VNSTCIFSLKCRRG